MRLRLAAEGDTIVFESELKAVTVGAALTLLSVVVFLVLDWTHPFSSLECVRHEWNRGGSSKVSPQLDRRRHHLQCADKQGALFFLLKPY
jgi:hypothetical protein